MSIALYTVSPNSSIDSTIHYLCFLPDRDNTWLGFGLSGSDTQTIMRGADVSIVWVDEVDGPHAEDYHLSEYTQVPTITLHTLPIDCIL